VIVNNDRQAAQKKGSSFMPAAERVKLVRSIECVDAAIESVDEDRTCCKTVRLLMPDAFTNGGDQNNDTIPEAPVCREIGCELVDGLGLKVQSSSWLMARVKGQAVKIKTNPNE
jgi:glycerol-3-phosphate cytidylyltransferase-like family protein